MRIDDADGGSSELHLLVPGPSGELRRIYWTGVPSPPAVPRWSRTRRRTPSSPWRSTRTATASPRAAPGTETTIAPRPFAAVAAVQDATTTSGHAVEVLFTQDVDLQKLLPADPARFTIPGLISNGGLIQAEADFCEGGLLGGCNGDLDEGENTGPATSPVRT